MADMFDALLGGGDELNEGAPQSAPSGVSGGEEKPPAPAGEPLGPLLDEPDPAKVARKVEGMLRAQAKSRKRRRLESQRNELWLKGVRGVRVRYKSEDLADPELLVPLGSLDLMPAMDRADELIDRTVAHLLVDPPSPEAEPATDSDADRDAAEVTTRILQAEGAESGFNYPALFREAASLAAVHKSAFVYASIDPTGGGWRPMEVKAHPMATHKDAAEMDPATGQPAPEEALVPRFVAEDGALTDDPKVAGRQWLPAIRHEVLTPNNVALLPERVRDITEAKGAILIQFLAIGELKERFPDVKAMSVDQLKELVGWRPDLAQEADPDAAAHKSTGREDERVSDDDLACVLAVYYRSHGQYPKGAYVIVAGGKYVLHRQPWCATVEVAAAEGQVSATREECLPLPLAQFRCLNDKSQSRDPMGVALVERVGPVDEIRGTIITAYLEHLDRAMHPNVFLPMGTTVQPGQLDIRDGTPVYFNQTGGGVPVYEDVPEFSGSAIHFLDRSTDAGNDASGLSDTAQGVENSSSVSGKAKEIVVSQAAKNLATMRQNLADGVERTWRIGVSLIRAFYTIPQKTKYEGEDGSFRLLEWSRTSLGDTKDIKIRAGSFTQLGPEQKQAMADQLLATQVIGPDEYKRLIANGVRPTLGFKDDPHLLRVRGQIAHWKEGPPEGWTPPEAPVDPMTGAPMVDPMTGAPVPPPVDPANPFADARLVDDEQAVALVRYGELARVMGTSSYGKHAPEWRAVFDAEYMRARQAAGVQTLAEQQAALAAQQAQQMAAEADAQGAESAEKDKDRAFKSQEAEAGHARSMERDAFNVAAQPQPGMMPA